MRAGHMRESTSAGPLSYRNWHAQRDACRTFGASEIPLYSDVLIRGQIETGLGPYALRNALPADTTIDPVVILIVASYLDPNDLPKMDKTNVADFTGAYLGDELAALCALTLGVRLMAGQPTRYLSPPDDWIILGDRERPMFYRKLGTRNSILPQARNDAQLDGDRLATFPTLSPVAATALVRAARLYRDGLWIAEAQPELAWLLLVAALEVAAVQQQIDTTPAIDILRSSKPKLVESLEAKGLADEVATAFARELRATARFREFMSRFMPPPPKKRPPQVYQLDWSDSALKRVTQTVYSLRSQALHEGIPFPPPMCEPPLAPARDWDAPSEKAPGSATTTANGVWVHNKDAPLLLHTFEYMTRGALLNWWDELARHQAGRDSR